MYEEKQPRLAKAEGISSQGDFEQRRSGWGKPENKATCYECGNTDHFKAQCPIWIAKNKIGKVGNRRLIQKAETKRRDRKR